MSLHVVGVVVGRLIGQKLSITVPLFIISRGDY